MNHPLSLNIMHYFTFYSSNKADAIISQALEGRNYNYFNSVSSATEFHAAFSICGYISRSLVTSTMDTLIRKGFPRCGQGYSQCSAANGISVNTRVSSLTVLMANCTDVVH